MDVRDSFGEILEKDQSTVSDFAKTAKGQIVGKTSQGSAQTQKMSDDQAKQFLSDLYGPSKPNGEPQKNQSPKQNSSQASTQKENPKDKTPQELAKIESLKRQLHADYYQNLVNPPKPKEENVAEKIEREEGEEKMEEIEEEKKKLPELPITVKRGTNERIPGVSG